MEERGVQETSPQAQGLLTVAPPRLEDAGLEDCALPPDAIKLAFLKAANAIGSVLPGRLGQYHEQEDGDFGNKCVDDPAASDGKLSNSLLGAPFPEEERQRDPFSGRDGIPEVFGDDVVVGGEKGWKGSGDRILGLEVPSSEDGRRACVDGFHGLEGMQKEEDQHIREPQDDKEQDQRPFWPKPIFERRSDTLYFPPPP